jgi:integrase
MARRNTHGVQGLIRRVAPDGAVRWSFHLRWRTPTGKYLRHYETMPTGITITAAKARAKALLNAAMNGEPLRAAEAERKLGGALAEYLKWRKDNGRTNLVQSRLQAQRFVTAMGNVPLAELSPLSVERYKRDMVTQGLGATSVNRSLTLWRHFIRSAARWGWVGRELAGALREVRSLRESPGRVRYLTPEEEARLMAALEGRPCLRRLTVAALLTGARQGELLRLRCEHVDLRAGELTLMRTKNGKVRRVPLAAALTPILREAISASASGYVFERDGVRGRGAPYTARNLLYAWHAVCAEAELEDLHWHDLRHSCATALRRRGAGLDIIGRLLGHSTLAMTARYAHIGEDALREAMRDLPAPGSHGLTTDSVSPPTLALVK